MNSPMELPLLVSEDLSGLYSVTITLTHAEGAVQAFGLTKYFQVGEGDTGTVTAVTAFPFNAESFSPVVGEYFVSAVLLKDRVGNSVTYTEAQGNLDAATLAWRLSIVNELPPPPAVVDVNLTNDADLAANLAALSPAEGQTIRVQLDISAGSVIPADAFAAIAGRNIEIVAGDEDLSLVFNGNDVTGTPKDVDTKVVLASTAAGVGFDGEHAAIASFSDNGELPGKMTLRVSQDLLRDMLENDGIGNVDFYFRNGETNELVHENVAPVEGIYSFSMTHHSDYIITATRYVAPAPAAAQASPQTGDNSALPVWAGLSGFAVLGLLVLCGVAYSRRRQASR